MENTGDNGSLVSLVALTTGANRYEAVRAALDALGPLDLRGRRRVVIKPNLVSLTRQLASTHVDAIRAVLDWLRPRYEGPVIIGEGAALGPSDVGYRNFGYVDLARSYDVRFVDFNLDERVYPVRVFDWRLRPQTLSLSSTAVDADFLISVGPPKTHDVVIITASIKNVVMGALIDRTAPHSQPGGPWMSVLWRLYSALPRRVRLSSWIDVMRFVVPRRSASHKARMHQSYPVIHLNLCLVARMVRPHLAVLDAWEAMEGDGPTHGDAVPIHAAVASLDPVAADAVAARMMGFDPWEIGYLRYCHQAGLGRADPDGVQFVGNGDLESLRRPFRPHSLYPRQRRWYDARVEALLGRIVSQGEAEQ
ncbi:MAG: DUF362 domain-containing protein [Anaerolineae bacterium]|nr:DUF362 domain-containing protein [Anaerolineae bacterium]